MTTPAIARRTLGLPFRRRNSPAGPTHSRRGRAFVSVVTFVSAVLVLNVGFMLVLDYGPRRLRDPEYGKRLTGLKTQTAAHPNRPVVVVVGSSRTAMGVRPGALADDADAPLMFNMSMVGSGPMMQLITVRRLLADGVTPDAVLLEYWPAFLREDGKYSEQGRFATTRLYPVDRQTIDEYFTDPTATREQMRQQRLAPWYTHRLPLMNQVSGSWLPFYQRNDSSFEKIDDWGWLPGNEDTSPARWEAGHTASAEYYVPLFKEYQVSPIADRAIRATVAELRAAGVRVGLVYLPESERFAGVSAAGGATNRRGPFGANPS